MRRKGLSGVGDLLSNPIRQIKTKRRKDIGAFFLFGGYLLFGS
jgi:hypothetical protein